MEQQFYIFSPKGKEPEVILANAVDSDGYEGCIVRGTKRELLASFGCIVHSLLEAGIDRMYITSRLLQTFEIFDKGLIEEVEDDE